MASLELEARLDNLLSTAQEDTKDIDLFAPIPEKEECPICLIPLPLNDNEITFMTCCGKRICRGCIYKNVKNNFLVNGIPAQDLMCAFCRRKAPTNCIKAMKKLIKNSNSQACFTMACRYKEGDRVFQSDTKAIEMYVRAAELGLSKALAGIGQYYEHGIVVEEDMSKALDFYEVAAKKGYYYAHTLLVTFNGKNGNIQKCIQHLKVAASAGDQVALDGLMAYYKDKLLSKEELTKTLHAFQASCNAMKSEDRENANEFFPNSAE